MTSISKRKWRRGETWLLVVPSLFLLLAWIWSATRPLPLGPPGLPPLYSVSDLGAFGAGSEVMGMNDHGDVVGRWGPLKNNHPFVWRNGKMQFLGSGSGAMTVASDINNAGEVCGSVGNIGGTYRAFLWRNGKTTFLPSLGGKASYSSAINERGQIVGYSQTRLKRPDGHFQAHAVMWGKGLVRDLTRTDLSVAAGINNAGEIAGTAAANVFLWRKGIVTNLGEAGTSAGVSGINDNGIIVGITGIQRYTMTKLLVWRDGRELDVQMPPDVEECFSPSINNLDQCVGSLQIKGRLFAFIYQNSQFHDLNALAPGSGWTLEYACDINERGQIVGMGRFNGQNHGFLLTPITR